MGNDQSNEDARNFFMGVGGVIERGAAAATNAASAPSRLMDSMGKFLTSPTSGIILPIVALGGLYIVMNFKR